MTPEQKDLVKSTWQKVVPIADAAADLFYGRLFEIDPGVRPLFANTDMTAQKQALLQALAATVANLDDLDTLKPLLTDLGRRHAGYGVEDTHYDSVGAAFLWTLEQGLDADWTPAAAEAWTAAYGLVAGTMQAGARADAA